MKTLILLLIFLAGSAQAQTVSVKSGEHGVFTRLVLTFPAPVDWVLGRTPQGYRLKIPGKAMSYDVSSIYQRITKDRLRSIWVDPDNGNLILGIDCECHALPFELTPKVLVIDIKDGAPPQNSSFEVSLDSGTMAPPIQPAQRARPRRNDWTRKTYDWLDQASAAAGGASAVTDPTTRLDNDLRLQDFRHMLIDEVGRGATQGVVEMKRPTPSSAPFQVTVPQNARTGLREVPGIEISSNADDRANLMVQGDNCPKTGELEIGALAISGDSASELARTRAAMLAEFDVPDPQSVITAIDTHLYFGFGAEARLLLTNILPAARSDALRLGLSYLVDGDVLPENPFQGMQSCDSAAALWALLAAPADDAIAHLNGAAVSRAFLSLPTHLRLFLGPETAMRLLRSGDSANSEVVVQSFARAAPPEDQNVKLLRASQALENGNPAAAEAILPDDPTRESALTSLFTRAEARFQLRNPLEGKDLLALEAFAFEHGNGPLRAQFDRALSHAFALGGDYASAFDRAKGRPDLTLDVWMLLADVGAETQLIQFAVGLDPTRRSALPLATRTKIAERLLDAGLPNVASDWISRDEVDTNLVARIALANGDARFALRLMAAQLPEADSDVMAAAYTALGDYEAAASTYREAGDINAALRAKRWARDWPAASVSSPGTDPEPPADPWREVATSLTASDGQVPARALQASFSRLEQSAATRDAIAALLATTPVGPPDQ